MLEFFVVFTLFAVFWRYVLNNPIFGIEDISVLVLVVIAASSVIYGARKDAHVSINIISHFFDRRITRVTDIVMRLLALVTLGMASLALYRKACGFDKACITENLSIEHENFFYILLAAMALYGVHILIQLIVGILHFSETDPNEISD